MSAELFKTPQREIFTLRKYQDEAVTAGIEFFNEPMKKGNNGIIVLPTGSGKSLVIASIIMGLPGKTIVLQPSKEILEQNHAKLMGYGYCAGIYSASMGRKEVDKITFATIGSVIKNAHLFTDFQRIIIDECHLVNSAAGMYREFIDKLDTVRVLGLTATPYRLSSSSFGSMLKFITRTKSRIFKRVLYYVQNQELFQAGYLAKLEYFDMPGFDRTKLKRNSSGSDFTDSSVKAYYQLTHFDERLRNVVQRLLNSGRKNVLVFTQLVDEARVLARLIDGAAYICGETPKAEREKLLKDFKSGKIKVMCNVGVLTTGFDYPELETVVIARPTMSLALYYQMVGRAIRIHPGKKSAYIVDMCDNIALFGAVEDIYLEKERDTGLWVVTNRGKPLTNVLFGEGKPSYLD